MSDMTARLRLPTIRAGQAQKESSHNEALALIDLLTQASVLGFGTQAPPPAPQPGDAWVIGAAPTGAWAGQAHCLAGWTEGGWRFAAPTEGLMVWVVEHAVIALFSGGAWAMGDVPAQRVMIGGKAVLGPRQTAIATPSGGVSVDVEARAAIAALLAAARAHGLIES